MWLNKFANALNIAARKISPVLHSVGLGVLAVMMFLTAFDVILRYVFNKPIMGAFELTEYMMAIVVAFSLAYCYVLKEHVTVDIVVNRFPQRAQAIIDSITSLIGFGIFCLITWQSGLQTKIQLDSGLTSAVLLIPAFPFVAVVAFGSAVLSLAILAFFFESLSKAAGKWK
jgi:TRAP-type transport system small permease protein